MTISERKMRRQFESNPLVLRLLFFWVYICMDRINIEMTKTSLMQLEQS